MATSPYTVSQLTSTNVVGRILSAIGSQPARNSIDIDAVADENALLAHDVYAREVRRLEVN